MPVQGGEIACTAHQQELKIVCVPDFTPAHKCPDLVDEHLGKGTYVQSDLKLRDINGMGYPRLSASCPGIILSYLDLEPAGCGRVFQFYQPGKVFFRLVGDFNACSCKRLGHFRKHSGKIPALGPKIKIQVDRVPRQTMAEPKHCSSTEHEIIQKASASQYIEGLHLKTLMFLKIYHDRSSILSIVIPVLSGYLLEYFCNLRRLNRIYDICKACLRVSVYAYCFTNSVVYSVWQNVFVVCNLWERHIA